MFHYEWYVDKSMIRASALFLSQQDGFIRIEIVVRNEKDASNTSFL